MGLFSQKDRYCVPELGLLTMDTVVVACRTLEDEIAFAMERTGYHYPVEFIESGLHERPKKLADTVQKLLNSIEAERVLLCLGQCGNSMVGIRTGSYEMILPKTDDCLSMLLGSAKEKSRVGIEDKAFFLTMGWLKGESTIMSEYERSKKRYGEETALSIMEMMYGHYKTMGLIDSGISSMDDLFIRTGEIAELLHLERKVYSGTTTYIEQLIAGPWDPDRFIVKPPFTAITDEDFRNML